MYNTPFQVNDKVSFINDSSDGVGRRIILLNRNPENIFTVGDTRSYPDGSSYVTLVEDPFSRKFWFSTSRLRKYITFEMTNDDLENLLDG